MFFVAFAVSSCVQHALRSLTLTCCTRMAQVKPVISELETVLRAFDISSSGCLNRADLLAGCASLGVVLSETELETLLKLAKVTGLRLRGNTAV
jgi:Ca2+-binding EF-hand superfamily protein